MLYGALNINKMENSKYDQGAHGVMKCRARNGGSSQACNSSSWEAEERALVWVIELGHMPRPYWKKNRRKKGKKGRKKERRKEERKEEEMKRKKGRQVNWEPKRITTSLWTLLFFSCLVS